MSFKKYKVLIVDDSALMRALLSDIVNADRSLEVCGVASDPIQAREMIKQLNPDVLTLDIEMPKMSGIEFLRRLMRLRPMPVVMISTLTQEGAPETLHALELGAVDFLPKPKNRDISAIGEYANDIQLKLRIAAQANLSQLSFKPKLARPNSNELIGVQAQHRAGYVCAIGASTGGTEAIRSVVRLLPADFAPVVVTQHIPAAFSASFAARVNEVSEINVCEAKDGQAIESGNVYIAPGDYHLQVKKHGGELYCALSDGPRVNMHKPSVEVMFDSVTEACGANATGVMLTGMGADGAEAMLRMRKAGATTLVQSEESSVIWGMPKAAYQLGAATDVVDLDKMATALVSDYCRKPRSKATNSV